MKLRLDKVLVELGFFESRNKAVEAIKCGDVLIDSRVADRASKKVSIDTKIELKSRERYVSRSAYKLKYYFDRNPLELKGCTVLDIGSSTGGFTQVVLGMGAEVVDAVDVGHNQLHQTLRDNKRVKFFEKMDIRAFKSNREYDLILSDLSFIPLNAVLKDIDRLARAGTDIILLFKPQFEVGRYAKRDSKGVVVDKNLIKLAKDRFKKDVESFNWRLLSEEVSLQKGKEGNQEYIFHFKKFEKVEFDSR
jgi:23S rRNA (cytidine1920-2'-O)/16S rRNA (cytidine1409-2'-O)-methyltransferase